MRLWEIQADSIAKTPLSPNREMNRKQLYYKITVLYADILNIYTYCYPLDEPSADRKRFNKHYVYNVWEKILELYLRALLNDGRMWEDKLFYRQFAGVGNAPTKIEAIMAIMNTHMANGLRFEQLIVKMINYHVWLKTRLNLENILLHEK